MVPPSDDARAESTGPTASLFGTQLLLQLVVLVVAAIAAAGSSPTDDAGLTRALVALSAVTVVAAVAPGRVRDPLLFLVPLADIVAVVGLRAASPTGGFGVLVLIPVVWLTLVAGRRGAILATGALSVALWAGTLLERSALSDLSVEPPAVSSTASLNVAALFVAVVVASAVTRDRAHRRLVRRQSASLADSLRVTRRDERFLLAVVDAVPFAVISIAPDGVPASANRATRAMLRHLGLNPALPADQYPLYHLDGVTPVATDDFPHRRGLLGEPVDAETYWLGHADGPRLALEVSARIVLDDDGALDRLVVVARDVGDTVAADEARDRAVTSISHEFRTPLSSILGFLDLAADTPGLPPEAADHLGVAERNTTRLLTLVNDLLAARARTPRTTIPMTIETVDLVAVVAESVTALRPLANDRVVTLTADLPARAVVDGDAFRLRQVVDNLISNAIKYNVAGGTVLSEITADADGTHLVVTDTGTGMSDRELTEVFEPYQRSSSAVGSTIEGTGMGLAICRDIVELHGGTIELRHADTGGTSAHVVLPAREGTT